MSSQLTVQDRDVLVRAFLRNFARMRRMQAEVGDARQGIQDCVSVWLAKGLSPEALADAASVELEEVLQYARKEAGVPGS